MSQRREQLRPLRRLCLGGLLVGLCLLSLPARAQTATPGAEREQPITIEADRAEINDRDQTSVYSGNVVLTQGGLKIWAGLMTVYLKDKQLQKVVAEGKPVRYEHARPGQEAIRGQSQRLDYSADTDQVLLTQEAQLSQGDNRFSGDRILYDLNTQNVVADGSRPAATQAPQRVHITIQPKSKAAPASPPAP
jgi:lipopolysaccharide export system protein LptA